MIDAEFVAVTLWGEARSEPIEGRIAIASVLRNRLRTGRWGSTYETVCTAPMQFSCWTPAGGEVNYEAVRGLAGRITQGIAIDDPIYAESRWIADGLLRGIVIDRVQQATHYFVATTPIPQWAKGHVPTCRVGAHLFFAGIA